VPAVDAHAQILEQPYLATAAAVSVVRGERDEIEVVDDRQSAREIGDEDDCGLERGNEDRFEALVGGRDLGCELLDASLDLLPCEVDLADPLVGGYEARSSLYRWARRSMSRR
jgi:hypothetical protein